MTRRANVQVSTAAGRRCGKADCVIVMGAGVEQGNVRRVNLDGIAVIGIAARFPGAEDCHQFWENLKNVTCSIREVPAQRWDADRYYSPVSEDANKSVSKWGGFVDGVDLFDPMFFGISPREARVMDPQQRIALELAWACIEGDCSAATQRAG